MAESAKTAFLFASESIGVRQKRPFNAAKMDSVGICLRGLDFKKECGITYIKTIPQGFICYLSFTGQQ
ncbi:MAG: hypothetical protein ACTTJN_09180 [Prevotella intermedia]